MPKHIPDKILKLIEDFKKSSDGLYSPNYNETELRTDYVNPLFAKLGWNINIEQGYSQTHREVINEAMV